jgi:hypothetical protein
LRAGLANLRGRLSQGASTITMQVARNFFLTNEKTFSRKIYEIMLAWKIEKNLTKENCIGLIKEVGIAVPAMYLLGFNNNNCIGCVKGGMGYWNNVRKHFPENFNRMALIEREVGHSCIKGTFLDELDPNRGHEAKEPKISCDFICQSVLSD